MMAEAALAVRQLMRGCRKAALATAGEGGRPTVSLVTVAFDVDAGPILLLSRLADHTRNIDRDPRVALLFDGTGGLSNPQQGPRVTLEGSIGRDAGERLRRRFLARHPKAALYAGFADFAIFRVEPGRAHWVGGFGKARWIEQGLTCPAPVAAAFAAAEEDLLAAVNDRLGGAGRAVAVDPDGCDLRHRGRFTRRCFTASLAAPAQVMEQIDRLTTKS
ncbi:MAG TPA: heme iron utilization protein [Rhodospirillaceae bacterium]|nr:heme iron utilization protein [Rhodospirillaceae bacterium]